MYLYPFNNLSIQEIEMERTPSSAFPAHPHRQTRLFPLIRKLSILKHLSYGREPCSLLATAKILPEVIPFLLDFKMRDISRWEEEMQYHNAILHRGSKVIKQDLLPAQRLLINACSRQFRSLDHYILNMHADKLANILEACLNFAERVYPLVLADPGAPAWRIHKQFFIQSRKWRQLKRRVLDLIDLLIELANKSKTIYGGHRNSVDDWPNHDMMWDAVQRAACAFRESDLGPRREVPNVN